MLSLRWSSAVLCAVTLGPACSGKSTTSSAGEQQHAVIQCSDYRACDVNTPCSAGSCISVPGCGSAVCADPGVLCEQACGERGCAVAESYPEQLSHCPDGTRIEGKGQGRSGSGDPGAGGAPTSGGASPGGYVGTAGYASGGSTPAYSGGGDGCGGLYGVGGHAMGDAGSGGAFFQTTYIPCAEHQRCGGDTACSLAGTTCVGLPGCSTGICLSTASLCESCPGQCSILESYPVQVACSNGAIVGWEPGAAGASGAGFGGAW